MPYIQDFPVPQGATLDVDFQIVPPGDVALAGGRVLWGAWEQAFGVPITADPSGTPLGPLISKDSARGEIDILESPESFTVHLLDADTALLPLGNYFHEAHVTDANGNDTPVTQGTMNVTLALIEGQGA
jgi:hypothetical protein